MDLERAFLLDDSLDCERASPVATDDSGDDEEVFFFKGGIWRRERLFATDHRGGVEEAGVIGRGADDRAEDFRAGIPIDDEVLVAVGIVATDGDEGGLGVSRIGRRIGGLGGPSPGSAGATGVGFGEPAASVGLRR